MSKELEIAVLPPAGACGHRILPAVQRAGELPLVDLTGVPDRAAIAALSSGRGGIGVVIDAATRDDLIEELAALRPDPVIIAGTFRDSERDLADLVSRLRHGPCRLFREVVSLGEATIAKGLGFDGVVVNGNEGAGRVAAETTWVLLQKVRPLGLAMWARGGIGLHSLASCVVAGASGAVLDDQLALSLEAGLPEPIRATVEAMDGSETAFVATEEGPGIRLHRLRGARVVHELEQAAARGANLAILETMIASSLGAPEKDGPLLIGQSAGGAASLASRYGNVAGILRAFRQALADHLRVARKPILAEDSPLARAHGTRYPIVQGPMTRVSDVPRFAERVAIAGGLPFLALALMRGDEVRDLMARTASIIGGRPWGVGILGFVPPDLRREQLEAVAEARPSYALLAGGRPDQAGQLESQGIRTYVHAPTPGLLRMFLQQGARRFIFEGRECGGHVGPMSSAVLWDSIVDVLLEHREANPNGDSVDVLFAGGIHDGPSSAMVSVLAAPLVERGIRVGVLMGTAYLFTREAVEAGAIVSTYQQEMLRCDRTVLLDAGGGHALRCAPTEYSAEFYRTKRRLEDEGLSAAEVREVLEGLNVGRLRIATKGLKRTSDESAERSTQVVEVGEEVRRREGMFMVGDVAALHSSISSIEDLHHDVADAASRHIDEARERMNLAESRATMAERAREPIAIVGIAGMFPGAGDVDRFTSNLFANLDSIREVPPDRWDPSLFYDSDRGRADRIDSKWGGFLEPVILDPTVFGIPPAAVGSIEPTQLMVLEVVRRLFVDSGYDRRPFNRDRTAVIIGHGGGASDLGAAYQTRCLVEHYLSKSEAIDPDVREAAIAAIRSVTPSLTEDSFPGILGNVSAGRVANRFNLNGPNYTIDAACASSLAAIEAAVRELRFGTSDTAIVGGFDGQQHAFGFLLFSKTHALSPTGRCRPFDAAADGIAISEAVIAVMLKRLRDAERDGDRIYAVIRGIGSSSDGRDKSLTAPSPNGQRLALERAYESAGVDPRTVGLVEAHGTGTVVGDRTELATLSDVFGRAQAEPQSCALGSVKSQIGHTKNAAGLAGLVKATLGLHYRVLPPTLAESPNSALREPTSPFFLNTRARAWIDPGETPRRAGVSAFGFGGTNFHCVLEEYPRHAAAIPVRTAEIFVFRAADRRQLAEVLGTLVRRIDTSRPFRPIELSAACWNEARAGDGNARLSIVASSREQLLERARHAQRALDSGASLPAHGPLTFAGHPADRGKIAFLFPGQGSQSIDMLQTLAWASPTAREIFERADALLDGVFPTPLSRLVFPPPGFSEEERQARQADLDQTWVAQPALGAANWAAYCVLDRLGIAPDMVAGHSYGEYVALCAGGVIGFDDLIRISERRGRVVHETQGRNDVAMVAVAESVGRTRDLLVDGVSIAGSNAPRQTIVGGSSGAMDEFLDRLDAGRIEYRRLRMSAGFHIPEAAEAAERFSSDLRSLNLRAPNLPVYSNLGGALHPADPAVIRRILLDQLVQPVCFLDQVEAMYRDGARVFIEVGSGNVLSGLARQTLAGREAIVIPVNRSGSDDSFADLLLAVGQLFVAGASVELEALFEGCSVRRAEIEAVLRPVDVPSPTAVRVDGGGVRSLRDTPPQSSASRTPEKEKAARQSRQPARRVTTSQGSPLDALQTMMERFLDHQERAQQRRHELMAKFIEAQRRLVEGGANESTLVAETRLGSSLNESAAERPQAPSERPAIEPLGVEGPAAPEETSPVGRERVRDMVLAMFSERTGYPVEMLNLDDSMEGDLGIDSIKRTEIFGAIRERIGLADEQIDQEHYFLAIARLRTLREVLEWLEGHAAMKGIDNGGGREETPVEVMPDPSMPHESTGRSRSGPEVRSHVRRYVVELCESPALEPGHRPGAGGGVTLLSCDQAGFAKAVATSLAGMGVSSAVVQQGRETRVLGPRNFEADLRSPESLHSLKQMVRERMGRVSSICHLLPVDCPARPEEALEVRSLFSLASVFGGELIESRGSLLAVTRGGRSAPGGSGRPFRAGESAVPGFLRSLAREWPGVLLRSLSVGPRETPDLLQGRLLTELGVGAGHVDVVYDGGGRRVLRCVERELDLSAKSKPLLDERSVVLATGGARGITAELCEALASRYRCRFVLTGRSVISGGEPEETANVTVAATLKMILADRRRRRGERITPALIERDFDALVRSREVRRTIERLRAWGVEVEYEAVDVRDREAMMDLMDRIRKKHGRLDAIVHGAGIVEDQLLMSKSIESFDRVFETKINPALAIIESVDAEELKLLAFMSSVGATFGYPGGTDYCAANEALNELAHRLDREWPHRVMSIGWGPWSDVGMASRYPEGHFDRQGMVPMSPRSGCERFIREIEHGRKEESEILIYSATESGLDISPMTGTQRSGHVSS